ncbi:hypothetical protein NHJ13051_001852 [Beauveria bassiana]
MQQPGLRGRKFAQTSDIGLQEKGLHSQPDCLRRPANPSTSDTMITKYMTEITARFNPFSACAKPARLFLTLLPPNARSSGTTINTTLLPRTSTEPSSVAVKFKDGKELKFNTGKITIKGLVEEMDRHSRQLQKKADLSD